MAAIYGCNQSEIAARNRYISLCPVVLSGQFCQNRPDKKGLSGRRTGLSGRLLVSATNWVWDTRDESVKLFGICN